MTDDNTMTDAEHKKLVGSIFLLFRQLPTLSSQIELLGSLTKVLMDRPTNKMFRDWLFQAEGELSQAARFMTNDDEKDGPKI